jgi:hypothetical protein
MSNRRKIKRTSTHGGDLGLIVLGSFEDQDGSVSAHVWDRPGWDYRDYCVLIPSFLQVFAEKDNVPIEIVLDCLCEAARRLKELRPTGMRSSKH